MELNKIYNEDCLDTMGRMEDNFIDLTVTSPPYDDLREYEGFIFPFEEIAKELYRVTKEGGVIVWVVGDGTNNGTESGTSFRQALYFKEIGFNLHDTMIYYKLGPPLTHNRYEQHFEYMFIFSKGSPRVFNPITEAKLGFKTPKGASFHRNKDGSHDTSKFNKYNSTKIKGNVWKYNIGSSTSKDKIAYQHPAIFPEQLAHDHIISWSNESDLVYDPFMGSGTTAKMAKLNYRDYIGSEISEEYCKISTRRIKSLLYVTKETRDKFW